MYDGEDYIDGLSLQSKYYDLIRDNWCVNIGSKRVPKYESLFIFKEKWFCGKHYSNYDTHFVVPSLSSDGISSLAFYVCKYLLKPNSKERSLQQALRLNLPEDKYKSSWNVVKSRSFRSSSFGLGFENFNRKDIIKYLQDCVARSDRKLGYPCFYNPDTGASFPLAPYYRDNEDIFSYSDYLDFMMYTPLIYDPDINLTNVKNGLDHIKKVQSYIDSKDLQINFNFLFSD